MLMHKPHSHTILYADDDADDIFMVQQAFEKYNDATRLIHASNGFEVITKLNSLRITSTLPCLIILDINMPGMNGKEALIRIKQDGDLQRIPVVLFTTSSSDGDRAFAKKWGAEFITKPLMYAELEELAKSFVSLCGETVSAKV